MHHAAALAALWLGAAEGVPSRPAPTSLRIPAAADALVTAGSHADRNDGHAESLRLSGYHFDPVPPGAAVEPAQPQPGDRLTVRITAPSSAADGRPIRYTYLWHRREGPRLVLVQKGDGAPLKEPVRAGERWRVFVVANTADGRTATSWGEVCVGEIGPGASAAASAHGQFLLSRAYLGFDLTSLAGRPIVSARLALYLRPDVSWRRAVFDTALLIYAVPGDRARFDEAAITWRNQPAADLPAEPLARIDLPGRSVTETDPKWQAWSRLHGATWADRGRYANPFSNDPQYGVWRWEEVDVTEAVRAAGGWVAFCLAAPRRTTGASAACAVRTREYEQARFAPTLVVTCR